MMVVNKYTDLVVLSWHDFSSTVLVHCRTQMGHANVNLKNVQFEVVSDILLRSLTMAY